MSSKSAEISFHSVVIARHCSYRGSKGAPQLAMATNPLTSNERHPTQNGSKHEQECTLPANSAEILPGNHLEKARIQRVPCGFLI
jgi:hypothetical protein